MVVENNTAPSTRQRSSRPHGRTVAHPLNSQS